MRKIKVPLFTFICLFFGGILLHNVCYASEVSSEKEIVGLVISDFNGNKASIKPDQAITSLKIEAMDIEDTNFIFAGKLYYEGGDKDIQFNMPLASSYIYKDALVTNSSSKDLGNGIELMQCLIQKKDDPEALYYLTDNLNEGENIVQFIFKDNSNDKVFIFEAIVDHISLDISASEFEITDDSKKNEEWWLKYLTPTSYTVSPRSEAGVQTIVTYYETAAYRIEYRMTVRLFVRAMPVSPGQQVLDDIIIRIVDNHQYVNGAVADGTLLYCTNLQFEAIYGSANSLENLDRIQKISWGTNGNLTIPNGNRINITFAWSKSVGPFNISMTPIWDAPYEIFNVPSVGSEGYEVACRAAKIALSSGNLGRINQQYNLEVRKVGGNTNSSARRLKGIVTFDAKLGTVLVSGGRQLSLIVEY